MMKNYNTKKINEDCFFFSFKNGIDCVIYDIGENFVINIVGSEKPIIINTGPNVENIKINKPENILP